MKEFVRSEYVLLLIEINFIVIFVYDKESLI